MYEHLATRLKDIGYELVVITNEVEPATATPIGFQLLVEPFGVSTYRAAVDRITRCGDVVFAYSRCDGLAAATSP